MENFDVKTETDTIMKLANQALNSTGEPWLAATEMLKQTMPKLTEDQLRQVKTEEDSRIVAAEKNFSQATQRDREADLINLGLAGDRTVALNQLKILPAIDFIQSDQIGGVVFTENQSVQRDVGFAFKPADK